ncbi:MAG: hypothetical protein HS115_06865 [Spirochaetales bacterium]|nr:hypothetical protein [Spirochaetales bacterium]
MKTQQARSRGPQAQAGARSSPVQRHVVLAVVPGRIVIVALEAPTLSTLLLYSNANNTASTKQPEITMRQI